MKTKVTTELSPFAAKMLSAFRELPEVRVAHPCGGFTTDDVLSHLGEVFASETLVNDAIDELEGVKLIRCHGFDAEEEVTCYGVLTERVESSSFSQSSPTELQRVEATEPPRFELGLSSQKSYDL